MLSLVTLFIFGVTAVFAGNKTEKSKVYGICVMCESHIEKAVKSVAGVSAADWDKETKMITLTFDDSKTDADKVQMAIAKVEHDTDMHKAKDAVYNQLPGCCHYDRVKTELKMNGKMNVAPMK